MRSRFLSSAYQKIDKFGFVKGKKPLTREQAVRVVNAGIWERFSGWEPDDSDELGVAAIDAINAARPGTFT